MKIERPILLTAVATVLASVLFAASATELVAQSAGTLDGTWTAVSAERNGTPADDVKGHRLTFARNTFVIEREGKTLYKGTFKTDPAKKPAQIDFVQTEGQDKGKTWRGIYLVEGDTLRTNDNAPDISKPRPTQFTTAPGSGYVLVVFKRG